MTAQRQPAIAVVCRASLLAEAIDSSLRGLASVFDVPPGRSDLVGLLDSLAPAGIVVDDDSDADAAAGFALRTGAPLLRISLRDSRVERRQPDGWEQIPGEASPELVRNALLAALSDARPAP